LEHACLYIDKSGKRNCRVGWGCDRGIMGRRVDSLFGKDPLTEFTQGGWVVRGSDRKWRRRRYGSLKRFQSGT
jgi:hypothetical protein